MYYAIIVAGGKGLRMGGDIPKQFLELNTRPVLMHTIQQFATFNAAIHIILVLPQEHQEYWNELCKKYNFTIPHTIVNGGSERFYSVRNGLQAVTAHDAIVAIHDGVRPLVSLETIARCFETARTQGTAVPCLPAVESVRIVSPDTETSKAIDRNTVRLIQTPQTFRVSLLQKAYEQPFSPFFTDDASVVEQMGETITLVEGNRENIKITSPIDLLIARQLLNTNGRE